MKLSEIDPNFAKVKSTGLKLHWHRIDEPFSLSGFPWFKEEGVFCRISKGLAVRGYFFHERTHACVKPYC